MDLKNYLFVALLTCLSVSLMAQDQSKVDIGLRYMEATSEKMELSSDDIKDPLVSDMYTDAHNGVTHLYLNQTYKGIPIHNAIVNLSIKEGKVVYATGNFVSDLNSKISNSKLSVSIEDAIVKSAKTLGVTNPETPQVLRKTSDTDLTFAATSFTNREIPVTRKYQLLANGDLSLCWDFSFDMKTSDDYWSLRVDGATGAIVDQHNYTVYCKHEKGQYHNHDRDCGASHIAAHQKSFKKTSSAVVMDASYNIFELPTESPIHGSQVIVNDPADAVASPFGWHDIDGVAGPEFTITRGNNVHAYADHNGDGISDGIEPDGGASLVFDFAYDALTEPIMQANVAQVNLFYMNNMLHDISTTWGFDEAAGNFQQTNYSGAGQGGDAVQARAQAGAGILPNPDFINNANFGTPPEGNRPSMNMFLWDAPGGIFLITEPTQLEGFYPAGTGDFGEQILTSGTDINENVQVSAPLDACDPLTNDLTGTIALVNRGGCDFSLKTFNAQEAGAIACIICNIPGASSPGDDGNTAMGMTGGDMAGSVTIPTASIGKSTCDAIRLSLEAGIPVKVHLKNHTVQGADYLDGDFDNGIIAHEYGHGISTRLTGGPNIGCLGGDEQMGEGWSDFFALVLTHEMGDTGADAVGIGNYANGTNPDAIGIRHFPYSTDMSVSPNTYNTIRGTNIPHGVGEVWASMIWDLYWAFIDLYGFDPDWNNTSSGNSIAVRMVLDGCKMQGCNPGFVDGRDAILMADELTFNGDHACMIWEVFARRGLGFFADQGDTGSAADGTENFDPLPTCIDELKITKTMDAFVDKNTMTEVKLVVTNHVPETLNGVVVTDELPGALEYVDGTASMTAVATGDMISFNIGTMEYLDVVEITYMVNSGDESSTSILYKDLEEFNLDNFFNPQDLWGVTTAEGYNGSMASLYVSATDGADADNRMTTEPITVSGSKPTLRWFQRYDTEAGSDAGFIEISTDGGNSWVFSEDDFVYDGYNSPIAYGTLAIPNLSGFGGLQEEWRPIYLDLSSYAGQTIQFRFRFVNDDNTIGTTALQGWLIDNFEIVDLLDYQTVACVEAETGEMGCSKTTSLVVNGEPISNVIDTDKGPFEVSMFPNPASDLLNIKITSSFAENGLLTVHTLDGKKVIAQNLNITANTRTVQLETAQLPSGFYLVRIETPVGAISQKIVIE